MPLPDAPLPLQKNHHPFSDEILDFFRDLTGKQLIGFYKNNLERIATSVEAVGGATISIDKEVIAWTKNADGYYQSVTVKVIYLGDTNLEYDGHALEVVISNQITEQEYREKFKVAINDKGIFWHSIYRKISEVSLYGRKFHTTRLGGFKLAEVELDTDLYNLILIRLETGELYSIDGIGSDADTSRTGQIIIRIYPVGKDLLFDRFIADRLDHYKYERYKIRYSYKNV